ncbi:MAG TPA: U32 family peptidase, partial [bacterium]|nr:U32 family peptidase [bacterium]
VSYSGRCLLSNYLASRDANRGDCAQSCRWKYALVEEKRPGEYLPVFEDERGAYIMNSKDLCTINRVHEFAEIGIDSLKIEGRMKGPHYVAVTTAVYKKAVESCLKDPESYSPRPELYGELQKISHRPYTEGFYFASSVGMNHYPDSEYTAGKEYGGTVTFTEKAMFKAVVARTFKKGQVVEIFNREIKPFEAVIKKIVNGDSLEEEYAKQGREYLFHYEAFGKIREGDIVRL